MHDTCNRQRQPDITTHSLLPLHTDTTTNSQHGSVHGLIDHSHSKRIIILHNLTMTVHTVESLNKATLTKTGIRIIHYMYCELKKNMPLDYLS